jgi:hypothetical protein
MKAVTRAAVTNPSDTVTVRTANLTLASFLAMSGEPYRLVRGQGQSAAWEFTGAKAPELKEAFDKDATLQTFHHYITRTRRVLFGFIESGESTWDEERVKADPNYNGKRSK